MKFPATDIEFAMQAEMDALRKRVSELERALEKIKFRNHPGTTNHELAKEALNHD
jgi:polyhydroxyalkanoate synthesis regulator phasin